MKTIVTFALLSFSLALGCGGEKQLESLEALRGKDAKTAEKIEKLVEKMHSPDPDVSLGAAQKLGKIGKPAVPILIELLRDENPMVRGPAAYTLGDIGDKKACKPIRNLLKDKDFRVRGSAAQALGMLKDKKSIKSLIGLLKEKDENLKSSAVWGLEKLTGEKFGQSYGKWMAWYEKKR